MELAVPVDERREWSRGGRGEPRWAGKDGFGRDISVENGYTSGGSEVVVSRVDYEYGRRACSPLGKVVRQSAPYGIATSFGHRFTRRQVRAM